MVHFSSDNQIYSYGHSPHVSDRDTQVSALWSPPVTGDCIHVVYRMRSNTTTAAWSSQSPIMTRNQAKAKRLRRSAFYHTPVLAMCAACRKDTQPLYTLASACLADRQIDTLPYYQVHPTKPINTIVPYICTMLIPCAVLLSLWEFTRPIWSPRIKSARGRRRWARP